MKNQQHEITQMKRIIVIGCPGSGKSTFARALRDITGLPLYYLDMLKHKPDKTTFSKREFDEKLKAILDQDTWIIDGNYGRTLSIRVSRCDTIFWLDYSTEVCLKGVADRMGIPREDMPWFETEQDEKFLDYIKNFRTENRPEIARLLKQTKDKEITIFQKRKDASDFLENIRQHRTKTA